MISDDEYFEVVETALFQAKFELVALEDATDVVYTRPEIERKFEPTFVERWDGVNTLFVTDHAAICKYVLDHFSDHNLKFVHFIFLSHEPFKDEREMYANHGLRYSKVRKGFVRAVPKAKKVDSKMVNLVKTYIKRNIERYLCEKFNLTLNISGNGYITLHNAVVLAKAHNLTVITALYHTDVKYEETLLTVPLLLERIKDVYSYNNVTGVGALSPTHQQELVDIINQWWTDATVIRKV